MLLVLELDGLARLDLPAPRRLHAGLLSSGPLQLLDLQPQAIRLRLQSLPATVRMVRLSPADINLERNSSSATLPTQCCVAESRTQPGGVATHIMGVHKSEIVVLELRELLRRRAGRLRVQLHVHLLPLGLLPAPVNPGHGTP